MVSARRTRSCTHTPSVARSVLGGTAHGSVWTIGTRGQGARGSPGGRPFLEELRVRLRDAAFHLVSGGTSVSEPARLLGVSAHPVRPLCEQHAATSPEQEPVALVPVVATEACAAAEPATPTLVFVSPLGYLAYRCLDFVEFGKRATHDAGADSSGAPHEFMTDFGPRRRSTVTVYSAPAAWNVKVQRPSPLPGAIATTETSFGATSPRDWRRWRSAA